MITLESLMKISSIVMQVHFPKLCNIVLDNYDTTRFLNYILFYLN